MQENTRDRTVSGDVSAQPTNTMMMDMVDLEDDFEELESLFTTKYGYSVCPETGRVIINVIEGMAIVENGRMKKYYEVDSPFRGKAGVRLSSVLPYSNLIAVVPDKQTSVTYMVPDVSGETQGYKQAMVPTTLWIRPNTVYIYDLVEKTIVYEKDFNCQIDYLKISNNFIAVSNAERVVIFHYKKELKKGVFKIGTVLEKIITGYEKGTFDDTVRYVEVEGAGMLNKGKLEMSLTDPTRLGFIKKERQSLYIYDSHLDIFLDVPMNKDEIDFSLSPDGKYAALISEGGVKIRVVEIDTRQTFTEFYRGSSLKPVAFSGFCQDWFALASLTDNNATLHFFPLRKQNTPTEVIYSQYKRYFNTFREPTNLFIKDNKVKVFSLVGCGFDVIDLIRARAKHAEDSSRVIKVKDVSFWAVDG